MDDRKITIAVCGDSYCSASIHDLKVTGAGTRAHFSQMLEDVYGYKVLYFAHGGFSNLAILFQIREAIKQKVDVVVYNKTWSNRLEIYRDDKFFAGRGLKNFVYYDPYYESSQSNLVGDSGASVLSTTHHGIEENPFFEISKEQKQAVDLYLKHLHNDNAKTLADEWMFEYWKSQMILNGILPVYFNDVDIGKIAYEFSFAHKNYDTPFHTDRATQEVVAANVHRKIVDNLKR